MDPQRLYILHQELKQAVDSQTLSKENANFLAALYDPLTPEGRAKLTHIMKISDLKKLKSLIEEYKKTNLHPNVLFRRAIGLSPTGTITGNEDSIVYLEWWNLKRLITIFRGRKLALDVLLKSKRPEDIKQIITDLQQKKRNLKTLMRNLARKSPASRQKRNNIRRKGK